MTEIAKMVYFTMLVDIMMTLLYLRSWSLPFTKAVEHAANGSVEIDIKFCLMKVSCLNGDQFRDTCISRWNVSAVLILNPIHVTSTKSPLQSRCWDLFFMYNMVDWSIILDANNHKNWKRHRYGKTYCTVSTYFICHTLFEVPLAD